MNSLPTENEDENREDCAIEEDQNKYLSTEPC